MDHALWFAGRATGLVSLLLLTATVVLGATHAGRGTVGTWPRFTVQALHRNLSLLTVAFLAVHVGTAVVDPYAPIRWVDAVVPFGSAYEPVWLGLGAVALDLLIAVSVTSLARARIGPRVWRAVHLAAYALWPLSVVHGLGIGGADSRTPWILAIDAACVLAVAAAVTWRLQAHDPDRHARRPIGATR